MARTTEPGFTNPHGQQVLGPTAQPGTDHGQRVYVLRCARCDHVYGANGSDIALRRCPACGGGRPGFDVGEADVIDLPIKRKSSTQRNPNWTRDELILALDLYFQNRMADENHPAVRDLSILLNRLWAAADLDRTTLRNPAGVSMTLGNFQALDPEYTSLGRKGLPKGGRLEKEIWAEFEPQRAKLAATATAIRIALEQLPALARKSSADEEVDEEASEGAVLTRLHRYRERDGKLATKKKAQVLARTGKLVCEACHFDFGAAYGQRGQGYIEVHHTKALETLEPGARTKLSELALLCANCHRMVHAKRPWLTMDQLKVLVSPFADGPLRSSVSPSLRS